MDELCVRASSCKGRWWSLQTYGTAAAAIAAVADQALQLASAANEAGATGELCRQLQFGHKRHYAYIMCTADAERLSADLSVASHSTGTRVNWECGVV